MQPMLTDSLSNSNSPTFTGTVAGITKKHLLGEIHTNILINLFHPNTFLNLKVDKVAGKGLSTEDYSTAEKIKISRFSGINTCDQI
jgi:hypothetical protein